MARMKMSQFEKKLRQWIRRFPDLAVEAMESVAEKEVIPHIQVRYLTGPRPKRLGVVSGDLRRSITKRVNPRKRMVQVGTNVWYGRYWEVEAKKPRPFLKPGIKDKRSRVVRAIAESVTRGYDGK